MVGWAVGSGGQIAKTTDGGNTWIINSLNNYSYLRKVRFRDINNGVIIGGSGEIFYTNNAGVSWTLSTGASLSSIPSYHSVEFVPNTSNAYAIGYGSNGYVLLRSANNGASWTQVSINSSITLNDISFPSASNGWIASQSSLLKTIDGGLTWQSQSTGFSGNLYSVQFINNQVGFVSGTLLKTTNGGNTWQRINTNNSATIQSFINESYGWWASGTTIVKYTAPQCSTIPKVMTNICCSTFETIKSGSWTDPTTWSCNRVPIATDDVIINTGHIITNSGGTIRAKSLNYRGGQLQLSPTSNLILGN
jgi:photosystem II stability/assembly factor-like uncharacterized protein